jgi:hypothetical protein
MLRLLALLAVLPLLVLVLRLPCYFPFQMPINGM